LIPGHGQGTLASPGLCIGTQLALSRCHPKAAGNQSRSKSCAALGVDVGACEDFYLRFAKPLKGIRDSVLGVRDA